MKVVGFTIVRNAVKYDYPVKESIESLLPLVDEMIVLVGKSEDETLQLIQSIESKKVKIHHSIWNDQLREGGHVLADETNKALALVDQQADWAFYIQADEVIPEFEHKTIKTALEKYQNDKQVEGLLLNYRHFYGSYDYIGDSRRWYPKEIRIIRPNLTIYSYRDAQGFRLYNRKLNVKESQAYIHHYGWVKPPESQQLKQLNFNKLWHDDSWIENHVGNAEQFDYSNIDSLSKYPGKHPLVMQERIKKMNWTFDVDPSKKAPFKYRVLKMINQLTGINIGQYQNYKLI
jgi:glycosyltransferase involved in cell wall biosynthesis